MITSVLVKKFDDSNHDESIMISNQKRYSALVNACLCDGNLTPIERLVIKQNSVKYSIDDIFHKKVLSEAGWSELEYQYGAKLHA